MPTQTELEFRATQGTSQNDRLAAYLRARPGEWIPMPELARVITETGIGAAVHSRIADCRKKFEMNIEQRSSRHPGTGLTISEYCYTP
jgi:hypothetical protein